MRRTVLRLFAGLAVVGVLVVGTTGLADASTAGLAGQTANAHAVHASSTTGSGSLQKTATCLRKHDVSPARLGILIGIKPSATTNKSVSSKTLEAAGKACQWALPSSTASSLRSLESCVAKHHVEVSNTGSTLADLLLLDADSSSVTKAVNACLPKGSALSKSSSKSSPGKSSGSK